MTRSVPHPEAFYSLLLLLSGRGYCSEARGGSRRVSRFGVALAAGLKQFGNEGGLRMAFLKQR